MLKCVYTDSQYVQKDKNYTLVHACIHPRQMQTNIYMNIYIYTYIYVYISVYICIQTKQTYKKSQHEVLEEESRDKTAKRGDKETPQVEWGVRTPQEKAHAIEIIKKQQTNNSK